MARTLPGPDALLRRAKRAPLLSAEEELVLSRRARDHDPAALSTLLESHLRLVLTLAHDYGSYGLPFEELVSEGLLGLCEAARRFEPERGARLSSYATFWIRAYMRRYTIAYRRIVRAPSSRHGRKLLAQLRRTQRELTQARSEPPSCAEVARVLHVEVRDVEEMEAALGGHDVPCDASDAHGVDLASEAPSPELLCARAEEGEQSLAAVQRALASLSLRERRIVEQRYLRDEASSFAAIGRDLGLSRERVRQLDRRLHLKLREAFARA